MAIFWRGEILFQPFLMYFSKKCIFKYSLIFLLVQCSGQMLRRPEHGRLNCPELTTWIAKPGQKCRLECDGGYKPSIDRVSTFPSDDGKADQVPPTRGHLSYHVPRALAFRAALITNNNLKFQDHLLRNGLEYSPITISWCFERTSRLCRRWSDHDADRRLACRRLDFDLSNRLRLRQVLANQRRRSWSGANQKWSARSKC